MAEISIRNLKKSYGSYTVMQAVSFDIAEGEFVVLVGPSGCGKSTLLRMIAGLEDISGGEILIDGKTVNDVPAKDRGIAMVFQNYALYPHMNVEQNMGFSLRIEGHKKQEIRERVAEVARILELTPLLHRKPRQLSGGQRQRVAMGRAIVRDPSIFLFDEPLSNLDAQLRVQMRAEVVAMHMRYKTTTVYVTHDQIEAMTMANRIVVMRQGHVEQIGRPLDLFDAPANVFVARFIGSPQMNLMDGRIEIRDGQLCFVAGDWVVPLDGKYDVDAGRAVILGFRPNRILLANGDEDGATSAVVRLLEVTGTETMVTLTLLERKVLAVFNERISAKFGETISVRLDASELHIFDQETEVRL